MDVKHQEETDAAAEKYLKKVKRLHDIYREAVLKKFESSKPSHVKIRDYHLFNKAYRDWQDSIPKMPCKIEIINTEANQLHLSL